MEILADFATWLAATPVAALVTSRGWIVPAIQVVHIIAIAAVVISVAQINRNAVRTRAGAPDISLTLRQWLPVAYVAVGILAVSGALLIASEPGRALFRTVFWVKIALIIAALALTRAHGAAALRARLGWHRVLAAGSVLLWVGVVFAGRWIAYADGWPGAPA